MWFFNYPRTLQAPLAHSQLRSSIEIHYGAKVKRLKRHFLADKVGVEFTNSHCDGGARSAHHELRHHTAILALKNMAVIHIRMLSSRTVFELHNDF